MIDIGRDTWVLTFRFLLVLPLSLLATSAGAQDQAVRMGCSEVTFDTVPVGDCGPTGTRRSNRRTAVPGISMITRALKTGTARVG